jgi:hypothetical protein
MFSKASCSGSEHTAGSESPESFVDLEYSPIATSQALQYAPNSNFGMDNEYTSELYMNQAITDNGLFDNDLSHGSSRRLSHTLSAATGSPFLYHQDEMPFTSGADMLPQAAFAGALPREFSHELNMSTWLEEYKAPSPGNSVFSVPMSRGGSAMGSQQSFNGPSPRCVPTIN